MDLVAVCLGFLTFINQHGDFGAVESCPNIAVVTSAQLQQIACNGEDCPAKAFYERRQKRIYLSERLDLEFIINRSIFLHELVHYVQDVSERWNLDTDDCRAGMQRELDAFRLQELYLLANDLHYPVSRNMIFYRC